MHAGTRSSASISVACSSVGSWRRLLSYGGASRRKFWGDKANAARLWVRRLFAVGFAAVIAAMFCVGVLDLRMAGAMPASQFILLLVLVGAPIAIFGYGSLRSLGLISRTRHQAPPN